MIYPQFVFVELFRYNTKITNASGLFAVVDSSQGRGLLLTNPSKATTTCALLETAQNINNISNMFFYCTLLAGAVPTFPSTVYTALNSVSGYLVGTSKTNITNNASLETRLVPLD